VIRRAICAYAVFLTPECGSIVCKSLGQVITTLIASENAEFVNVDAVDPQIIHFFTIIYQQ